MGALTPYLWRVLSELQKGKRGEKEETKEEKRGEKRRRKCKIQKCKKCNPNTLSLFVILGVDSHMIFCVDSHLSAPSSTDLAITEALLLLRYNTQIVIGFNGIQAPRCCCMVRPPQHWSHLGLWFSLVLVCRLDKLGE